jgi:hypothetical protein
MIATETIADATLALVTRFENGFNTRDLDALMADMTEDCVFEHVAPAAASFGRHEGQHAVRAVWQSMDEHFPGYPLDGGRWRRRRAARRRRHHRAGRQDRREADVRHAVDDRRPASTNHTHEEKR